VVLDFVFHLSHFCSLGGASGIPAYRQIAQCKHIGCIRFCLDRFSTFYFSVNDFEEFPVSMRIRETFPNKSIALRASVDNTMILKKRLPALPAHALCGGGCVGALPSLLVGLQRHHVRQIPDAQLSPDHPQLRRSAVWPKTGINQLLPMGTHTDKPMPMGLMHFN